MINIDISCLIKINGIKRKIIPIIDINRDKIWCLYNSFFNIILEKIGKNNKKYNLFSKTILLKDKNSDNITKYNINDITQKIKNIFRGLIFIVFLLYIYSIEEDEDLDAKDPVLSFLFSFDFFKSAVFVLI